MRTAKKSSPASSKSPKPKCRGTIDTALAVLLLALAASAPLAAQNRFLNNDFLIRDAFVFASSDNGVKSGTGVTVQESGAPPMHHTKFTLAAVVVSSTDHTTSGGSGSLLLYTFPQGLVKIDGCVANITTAKTSSTITTTAALVNSIGSVAEGGDASLTGTEADVIASTAGTLTSSAGTFKGGSTASVYLDGHTTAATLYLNLAMPDAASSGAGTVAYTGTLTCNWSLLGDW